VRARPSQNGDSRLSLKRVVGTTCVSPTGFDTVHASFAYIAGGAVVVVDVQNEHYAQRFYRARPTAIPLFTVSPVTHAPSTPNSTPKANDSRNRVAASPRDSLYGSLDWADSPSSKTWTSRERIKAATCLGLSRDGKYLAVGETGYAPRVLIFNLQESSSDIPLVSISEHTFGVNAVAWSPDSKFLASLGSANDGFLYLWKIDPRTGSAKLFQQNRCTSYVKGMIWLGSNLITLGVRHVKVWRVEDGPTISPTKSKFAGDGSFPAPPPAQKSLPGRNILLGSMLEATFVCAVAIDETRAIVCTETGDVCLLDDTNKQMKLARAVDLGFSIACVSVRGDNAYVGGKAGQLAVLSVQGILDACPDPVVRIEEASEGLLAMGFLADNLITIDAKRSIDIWSPDCIPSRGVVDKAHISIAGHGEPIIGIQQLSTPNIHSGDFFTWSGSGRVQVWNVAGMVKSSFCIPIELGETGSESDPINQLVTVRATKDGSLFFAGDKLGVLRIIDYATKECLLETKAHASNCQDIAVYENKTKLLVASCGRDRTTQLFLKSSNGSFEHFQTLEFAAKVVQVLIPSQDRILTCSLDRTLQVHDLITKEGDPDAMAAVLLKVISLKASPSSMAVSPDRKRVHLSLLDRSLCQYELATGRLVSSFKCTDEGGVESVVLDSLIHSRQDLGFDTNFLLGISNTDKSVRLYDAQTGSFLDREWGHTEAINGAILVGETGAGPQVVSVGSDGTVMVWSLELADPLVSSASRDPSPEKGSWSTAARPPLRRVLSKAELAEFQRPTSSGGRGSPPRILQRRSSRFTMGSSTSSTSRTPVLGKQSISSGTISEDTPSRRVSSDSRSGSPPPVSPKNRHRIFRRPSLPALCTTPPSASQSAAHKKISATNLRGGYGFGSLSMATEQTCRQLRAYRKRLGSTDPINNDILAELDAELRLTAAALGERAIRSRSQQNAHLRDRGEKFSEFSETLLNGLLDQYSERVVSMLDEQLSLRLSDEDKILLRGLARDRPRTAGEASSATSASSLDVE
jgi:WD40 repeat protein